jgi:hypothetical protein
MKLEVLVGGLDNPQPAVRLDVARVLGMLDETRALEAVRERYKVETDPTVHNMLAWAGKRLYEARQAGYLTLEELLQYFGVNREIENMPDPDEAEMMQQLKDNFDMEMVQMKNRANKRQMGMAVAAGIGGAMLGGAATGAVAFSGALSAGAGVASSNMGPRPQIGTSRAPATAPSNVDISIWVRRLRESSEASKREQAAIELGQLNNPAALPHLAAVFVSDPSPQVREAVQRFGKVLYWGAIYWEMEQDGSLAKEIEQRARAIGKIKQKPDTAVPGAPGTTASQSTFGASPPPPQPDVDVTEILRKAKQARASRKRKR